MKHIGHLLSAYCLQELSPEETRRVEAHLAECGACRAGRDEVSQGVEWARRLEAIDAPPGLWHQVSTALDERRTPRWRLACAAVAAASLAVVLFRPTPAGPAWEVASLSGDPQVAGRTVTGDARMTAGDRLVTDARSRARVAVGTIGSVQVEPDSRVRLVDGGTRRHRLALERGKLSAFIWAPPGQFVVDTASAVAVDLGCAYTLETDEDGRGWLDVTSGWVAFEWQGRESFVPAGARCATRPRVGPGTPFFADAPGSFQEALSAFDEGRGGLRLLLATARERDALTLWHLLSRTQGTDRGLVCDRLAALVPAPPSADRAATLRGDRAALDAWWDALGFGDTRWWRQWKGAAPGESSE